MWLVQMLAGIAASLVAATLAARLYERKCKRTARRAFEHGALEFNVTWLAGASLLMSFMIGTPLLAFASMAMIAYVVYRFWANWDRGD